mgnify:CR=1 FL=1
MDIKELVRRLIKKHGTTNPYTIIKEIGITIVYEDLGTINGYFNKLLRNKQIHINQNLTEREELLTICHELGHAIMHPNVSTPFLISSTYLSVNKLEIEANTFAINLLIQDADLIEYQEYSTEQLSKLFGYRKELIELRMQNIDGGYCMQEDYVR